MRTANIVPDKWLYFVLCLVLLVKIPPIANKYPQLSNGPLTVIGLHACRRRAAGAGRCGLCGDGVGALPFDRDC